MNPDNLPDLSEIEDSDEGYIFLAHIAGEATRKAAEKAKAMGLPQVYSTEWAVVEEWPDGTIKILSVAADMNNGYDRYYVPAPKK